MIRDLLYDETDIYENIPVDLTEDLSGWNGDNWIIKSIVQTYKPRLIIEVGTWKGLSAINMHKHLTEIEIPHEIVCVDTWLGSIEHMIRHKEDLRYDLNGHPGLYYQFLKNVVCANASDSITPLVQHSLTAAKWFQHFNILADMIYIDASHEQGDVIRDIESFWKCLKSDGVMFGDDYTPEWEGVVLDVDKFFGRHVTEIKEFYIKDRFWVAKKK